MLKPLPILTSTLSFMPYIADIGTDHAYLPTWLAERGVIIKAVAGDITEGPCAAARNTVAMYGMNDKVYIS